MKVIEDGSLDDLRCAVPVLSALGHCSTEPVAIASKIRSFTMPFLPPVALGCECPEFALEEGTSWAEVKTILAPSGDPEGEESPNGWFVRLVWPEPSAFVINPSERLWSKVLLQSGTCMSMPNIM